MLPTQVEAGGLYPYNAAARSLGVWAGHSGRTDELLINATPSRQRRPQSIARPPVLSRLLLFWLLLFIAAGGIWLFETRLGLSALWGIAVSALPGACFAWYSFRRLGGARQSGAAVQAIYRAETIKFLLTAALFAAVFMQVKEIHLAAFFIAFAGAHLGASLVTARTLARHQG